MSLARLLNLPENIEVNTEAILLDLVKYNLSVQEIYNDALQNLATFKAKELRIEAPKKGLRVVKSQCVLEVSIFGGVNTNYFSAVQLFNATGTSIIDTGDFVTLGGQNIPVMTQATSFEASAPLVTRVSWLIL